MKHTSRAIAIIVLLASMGYAQESRVPPDRVTPDFRVQIEGDIVADFSARVRAYVDLRQELEKGLPSLTLTDDPAEIRRAVHALAERVRAARAGAKEGDVFTPSVSAAFRSALSSEVGANTCAAISDDNPGGFSHYINRSYPDKEPLSTVPSNVLAVLPSLPDDLQYRFLGRHLILFDSRSGVILDRLRRAISCRVSR